MLDKVSLHYLNGIIKDLEELNKFQDSLAAVVGEHMPDNPEKILIYLNKLEEDNKESFSSESCKTIDKAMLKIDNIIKNLLDFIERNNTRCHDLHNIKLGELKKVYININNSFKDFKKINTIDIDSDNYTISKKTTLIYKSSISSAVDSDISKQLPGLANIISSFSTILAMLSLICGNIVLPSLNNLKDVSNKFYNLSNSYLGMAIAITSALFVILRPINKYYEIHAGIETKLTELKRDLSNAGRLDSFYDEYKVQDILTCLKELYQEATTAKPS